MSMEIALYAFHGSRSDIISKVCDSLLLTNHEHLTRPFGYHTKAGVDGSRIHGSEQATLRSTTTLSWKGSCFSPPLDGGTSAPSAARC
jgi:hypothetical protein